MKSYEISIISAVGMEKEELLLTDLHLLLSQYPFLCLTFCFTEEQIPKLPSYFLIGHKHKNWDVILGQVVQILEVM